MLANKQSKCEFLANAFVDSDCCKCLQVFGIIVIGIVLFGAWILLHLILNQWGYLDKDGVFIAMVLEPFHLCVIARVCIFTFEVVVRMQKNESLYEIFEISKAECYQIGGFVLGLICFGVLIYGIYRVNLTILTYTSPKSNSINTDAVVWVFYEVIVFPVTTIGLFLLVCVVVESLSNTIQHMRQKSKVYDTNLKLTHEKQEV